MRESFSLTAPPVLVATGSHVGRVRETNEDRVYADPERGSFAVIDGVGGHAAGEHAAQTALDTIRQRLQIQIGTPAERVREAIALANDQIRQQALLHPDRRGMACVLTLVLLQSGTLTAGHVGDTRLYKMRGGALRKLTHDHSPIGEREDRGELSEVEAMRHPRRNEIYREVGVEARGPDTEGFIDVIEEPFEADAALLLCSDGLSDALSSTAIAEIIHRHAGDPTMVVQQLIDQANDASGKDNVSVVYIEGRAFATSLRRGAPAKTGLREVNGTRVLTPLSTSASGRAADDAARASAGAGTGVGASAAGASASGAGASNIGTPSAAPAASSSSHARGAASAAAQAASAPAFAGASNARSSAATSTARANGVAGRVLLLVAGLLAGVALAAGAGYYFRDRLIPLLSSVSAPGAATATGATAVAPRTLTVGSNPDAAYSTIAQAMADARAGDTIQLQPGEYREQVVMSDGVTLTSASPREAVLRAPAQVAQPWSAIIIPGTQQGSRISGVKIAGDAQAPVAIGIHVLGRAVIDDVEVTGATIAGMSLASGSMSVTGASLHDNAGPGLALNGGDARLAHIVLTHNGTAVPPGVDIQLTNAPHVTFIGNVIAGDPAQRVRGLPADQVARFRETNVVIPASSTSASATRPRAAATRRAAAPASNR